MEQLNLNLTAKRRWYVRLGVGLSLLLVISGLAYYYWPAKSHDGINDYVAARDRQAILDIFERDWYWLVEGTRQTFSPEYMLDTRSPNKYLKSAQGQEKIKVFLLDGKLVGFITYYKKKAYQGQIHILAVLPEYRGRGYGKQLMRFAIADLFSDPAISLIKLVTRVNNPAAVKLYASLGFVEEVRDSSLVDFTLKRADYTTQK